MDFLVAALIACVSLLYATVGQAGGTAFLAIMAFASFPAAEMRPTALLLNIVAASYATWRLHQSRAIDWLPLLRVMVPSLPATFIGGLLVLTGHVYFVLTGLLLIVAAGLMIFRRSTDNAATRSVRLLPAALVGGGAGFVSGLTGLAAGCF
jgi:uncharacterized membrane protein YfcA